jgi:putative endonuclease
MPSSKAGSASGSRRLDRGRKYEARAADYLRKAKFRILARNWRAGRLEIDLIARRESLVVFVEVKSAHNLAFGHPVEKVDHRKTVNLTHAAQQYLAENDLEGCDLRFDVITFVGDELEHFPGAFDAGE